MEYYLESPVQQPFQTCFFNVTAPYAIAPSKKSLICEPEQIEQNDGKKPLAARQGPALEALNY